MGVNAKRPMPIAIASAISPARQIAAKDARGMVREGFDMGLHWTQNPDVSQMNYREQPFFF
ncbi:hypothetical protein APY03_5670 [Variovorax sp. WDL1]|nr:hypothetical protein APY03_5670 [Variovorax sp. WDL1]